MPQHTGEWFLEHLQGVEGSNGQYSAWCPCHDDIGTSVKGISLTITASGKVLIKCWSCSADIGDIARALEGEDPYGIAEGEFRPNVRKHRNGNEADTEVTIKPLARGGMKWWAERTGIPQATWTKLGVTSHEGGVAFNFEGMEIAKIRRPPKEFAWVGAGERPALWPLPDDELPSEIAICEGESDAGTLRHVGFHAFSITAGAGKSRDGSRYLSEAHFSALQARGVEDVLLCGDMDPSGAEMMTSMTDAAVGVGLNVSVLRLDVVIDPFSGINDLNGMWREAGPKQFGDLLQRAIQPLSAEATSSTLADAKEVMEKEYDWLIPELIGPADKILISGPQKSYKTWLALDLARAVSTGMPLLNRNLEWTPSRTARVLFVQEEGSLRKWAERLARLNLPDDAPFTYWHKRGFKFTDTEKVARLIDTCRREETEVLFLDPMQRMIPDIDENDSSETGVVWDVVQRIQEACPGIVVIILHHSNKTDRLSWESVRGSSRHGGEVDLGIFIAKHDVEDNKVRIVVDGRDIPQYMGTGESFECDIRISTKEEEEKGEFYFQMDATEIKVNVSNVAQKLRGKAAKNAVLEAVQNGENTRNKIMVVAKLSRTTVITYLNELVDEDLVEVKDPGEGMEKKYTAKEVSNGD